MENVVLSCNKEDEKMDLPPGFRFHPTDEELISHYLYKKVLDSNFSARAIGDVDLNKSEPWDLPCKLKLNKPIKFSDSVVARCKFRARNLLVKDLQPRSYYGN
jgi:hypothetical protein